MTVPIVTDKEIDVRSLCGIKDCEERATSLVAWPRRYPVPMCQTHWSALNTTIQSGSAKHVTPAQWLEWLKTHAKPHILPTPRPM